MAHLELGGIGDLLHGGHHAPDGTVGRGHVRVEPLPLQRAAIGQAHLDQLDAAVDGRQGCAQVVRRRGQEVVAHPHRGLGVGPGVLLTLEQPGVVQGNGRLRGQHGEHMAILGPKPGRNTRQPERTGHADPLPLQRHQQRAGHGVAIRQTAAGRGNGQVQWCPLRGIRRHQHHALQDRVSLLGAQVGCDGGSAHHGARCLGHGLQQVGLRLGEAQALSRGQHGLQLRNRPQSGPQGHDRQHEQAEQDRIIAPDHRRQDTDGAGRELGQQGGEVRVPPDLPG